MNQQAPVSLCPGYKYVDKFGDDDEYEEEEEVIYVTLDLGNVEPTLVPSSTEYRLIGLDTPTPYLQLQGTIFKGRHDMLLGTELVFTDNKDSDNTSSDIQDCTKKPLVHATNIEKRIAFKEVTLIPKGATQDSNTNTDTKLTPASTSARKSSSSTKKQTGKSRAKGKQKATSEVDADDDSMVDFAPEDHALQIDRMTGLVSEPTRAARKRKSTVSTKTATTGSQSSGTAKGKERAVEGRRQTRSRTHTSMAPEMEMEPGMGVDMSSHPGPAYPLHPPPLPDMQYSFPEEERQEWMDVDSAVNRPGHTSSAFASASHTQASSTPIPDFMIDPALLGPEERGRDDMDDMYVDEG